MSLLLYEISVGVCTPECCVWIVGKFGFSVILV